MRETLYKQWLLHRERARLERIQIQRLCNLVKTCRTSAVSTLKVHKDLALECYILNLRKSWRLEPLVQRIKGL